MFCFRLVPQFGNGSKIAAHCFYKSITLTQSGRGAAASGAPQHHHRHSKYFIGTPNIFSIHKSQFCDGSGQAWSLIRGYTVITGAVLYNVAGDIFSVPLKLTTQWTLYLYTWQLLLLSFVGQGLERSSAVNQKLEPERRIIINWHSLTIYRGSHARC